MREITIAKLKKILEIRGVENHLEKIVVRKKLMTAQKIKSKKKSNNMLKGIESDPIDAAGYVNAFTGKPPVAYVERVGSETIV